MKTKKLHQVYCLMEDLCQFYDRYQKLCCCHLVDYFSADLIHQVIPKEIRQEMERLTEKDYKYLFIGNRMKLDDGFGDNLGPHTKEFLSLVKGFLRRFTFLLTPLEYFGKHSTASITEFYSEKKLHEVVTMSGLVTALANKYKLNKVVDVGSGKGYLGVHLCYFHNFEVIGIDCSSVATAGAQKRSNTFQKFKTMLIKKFDEKDSSKLVGSDKPPCNPGVFLPVTQTFGQDVEWNDLLERFSEPSHLFGISGLHTCGDLSYYALHSFLQQPQAKFVCNVGCCYHLIQCSDFQNKTLDKFPSSNHFSLSSFKLERNARMLACQPPYRLANDPEKFNRTLFYRSVLQVILLDKLGDGSRTINIGREVGRKAQGFRDYVRLALDKLKLPITVSEEECDKYLVKFESRSSELQKFFIFRSNMAPIIEALITLDKLAFLLEQESVSEAHVLELFDPSTSPRCYCVVGIR